MLISSVELVGGLIHSTSISFMPGTVQLQARQARACLREQISREQR